jgi:hypothetical protein
VAITHARFAVLDLGSTTFQLLVADADAEGSLTPVLRDRVVLNLGRVLAGKGRIPDVVAERAAGTARRLTDFAVRTGADHVVPIATSALRDSPDRKALSHCSKERSARRSDSSTAVRGASHVRRRDERASRSGKGRRAARPRRWQPEVALADPQGLRWGRSLRSAPAG